MSEVTNEELLRLARKAWPGDSPTIGELAGWRFVQGNDEQLLFAPAERFHAALVALAGEEPAATEMVPAERSERDSLLALLSPRERQVVELLSQGKRIAAITQELGLSSHTTRNFLKHAFRKTGTHSQVELLSKLGGRHG